MKIQKIINDTYEQIHRIRTNLAYLYKFIKFVTPFLTIAFYFVFVFDYLAPDTAGKYGALVLAYLFPPAGKESIIPLMLSSDIPIWIVWSTIIIMDVISASIIAYNWWFAELIITHIPFLDRGYAWLQRKAEKFKKKKLLTLSLLLFMIVPFQGTGGISTPILSRFLGVEAKKTVLIVFAGSMITTTLWILWWKGFLDFLSGII